ncbi:Oxidoreductase, 2OG-Fe(II) oxygenase family [Shewanella piezotolerans WP3]|uniref:Oxidoreductase, 2OG-Fe(II) oxygenase family n=1 Tax=Shewanella piezotolerans (strain WP3 / JCM 13877) TaxID=225849 RepID=B8CMC2_SHEPW|nr:Oxidoreductase, 2OG-Fe(II) oxygenase family [Shewanella piezotolerans WP3]
MGAEHAALPIWENTNKNPANLSVEYSSMQVDVKELQEVPGAFQLLNVLSKTECSSLIEISEQLEFLPDTAVSLPRSGRHNDSFTWIVNEQTDGIIWQRIAHLMGDRQRLFNGSKALGTNARFRFYRYGQDDYFKPHQMVRGQGFVL